MILIYTGRLQICTHHFLLCIHIVHPTRCEGLSVKYMQGGEGEAMMICVCLDWAFDSEFR